MKYFIYLKTISLILFFIITAYGGIKTNYTLSSEFIYDSNIAQNINEYGKFFVAPSVYVKSQSLNKNNPFSLYGKFDFQNYLVEVSPILADPTLYGGFSLDFTKGENVAISTDYTVASYKYANWQTARLRYRFDAELKINLDRDYLIINGKAAYIHSGDVLSSGGRFSFLAGYTKGFKVLKGQQLAIRDINLNLEIETNHSRSLTESYNHITSTLDTEIKLWKFNLTPFAELSMRKFGEATIEPQTNEVITPTNYYFYSGADLSVDIIKDLSLKLKTKFRLKNSNMPTYDYNRNTFALQLYWASSFNLFE